jgi:antitoxin component HigA of HigAB toxin-antitoxin module
MDRRVNRLRARHFPMDLPDAVEAIKFRMKQAGLTSKISKQVSAARTACMTF